MTIVGVGVGFGLYFLADTVAQRIGFQSFAQTLMSWAVLLIMFCHGCYFRTYILYFITQVCRLAHSKRKGTQKTFPTIDMVSSVAGLIIGLMIAYLLTRLLQILPLTMQWFVLPVSVGLYIVLGLYGRFSGA